MENTFNKDVSSICSGLIESNYTLLHEDTSQDVYDGTVDSNTDECFFIDGDCQCDYYVELTTNQGSVYVVPPRVSPCFILGYDSDDHDHLKLIVYVILIMKCCIIYLNYHCILIITTVMLTQFC